MDVVGALRESCDTFFYETGRRTGIDGIARMARRMGLGEKLDFDVPGEVSGLVPDRAWKQKRFKQKWQQGDTINAAIGQGSMLATPLQLATMTARLVNGGKAVKPVLVRSIEQEGNKIPEWPEMGFHKPYIDLILKGMEQVVNDPRGTAFGSRITQKPYSMGGKTGTAQVKKITQAQRDAGIKNQSLAWKFRHHALFVGYGPVDDPKYVTAVVVEHGVGGAVAAAPMARDLLTAVQHRDPRKIRTVDDAVAAGAAAKAGKEKTP